MRRFKLVVATIAISALMPFAAAGASDRHLEPGTPGDKNCKGQTNAFIAQLAGQFEDAPFNPGLGNIARFAGLSVKEVQALVDAFCAQTAP